VAGAFCQAAVFPADDDRIQLLQVWLEGEIMANGVATQTGIATDSALRDSAAALRRVSDYRLPPALDRRLLWLSENKEKLSEAEREELLALVELAEERTLEKLQARAALKRLAEVWPHLGSTPS
jgi:hypothetical protein